MCSQDGFGAMGDTHLQPSGRPRQFMTNPGPEKCLPSRDRAWRLSELVGALGYINIFSDT